MQQTEQRQFMDTYGSCLNPQQREAVTMVEGPVLLLAVPGSGKTTVLVTRIGYMTRCCGIPPEHILTLTYTVAATRDMRERFLKIFRDEELTSRLEFRTINGICARIIAYYGRKVGKSAFELETNEKKILGILSGIYQKIEQDYASESDLGNIRTQITYIKNMRLTDEEIKQLSEKNDAAYDLASIYREYTTVMRQSGRMDYDDQMVYALNILRRSPDTLAYFQNQYRYICVDEAQDTSKIQHEIIALLASGSENLFMVGDEDQSIYGFRAAWPEALLHFEEDHPGGRVLLMEKNYRSVGTIVAACDSFIQMNTLRHVKHMKAERVEAGEIRCVELKARGAQYTYLKKVAESIFREGQTEQSTAVLYRDNESALPLIDLLDRNQIPFRVRNGEISFFGHRIVQDIRSILRLALSPGDGEIFMNVYYKMSSYLNKAAAGNLCQVAHKHSMGILDAAVEMGHLSPMVLKSCRALRRNLRELCTDEASMAIQRIMGPMGYGEYLQRSHMKDGKIAILRILAKQERTIQGFLDRLDSLEELMLHRQFEPSCPLILSTIHGSKGLEFDVVYLLDAMDGVFPETVPKSRDQAEEDEWRTYEEERRLFYVGATRAKDRLHVFSMENRDCTLVTDLLKGVKKRGKKYREEEFRRFCGDLGEGMPIHHRTLGDGVITAISDTSVSIDFDGKSKRFLLELLYMKDLLEY